MDFVFISNFIRRRRASEKQPGKHPEATLGGALPPPIAEQALGPEHPDLIEKLVWLAAAYRETAQIERVEPTLARAMRLIDQELEGAPVSTVDGYTKLLGEAGWHDAAEALENRIAETRTSSPASD